ncbi:MAG: AMP-binding protein [Candidatus Binatia bacterium]
MDTPTVPDMSAPPPTLAEALRARAADSAERVFLYADDRQWTFEATYREACRYAQLFLRHRVDGQPFHIGVLMDNLPAFVFAELGCGLAGAALVGLNPTRTGSALARDVAYADCQLVLVENRYAAQLADAMAPGSPAPPVLVIEPVAGIEMPSDWRDLEVALAEVDATDPHLPIDSSTLLMIVFTSGTTKAPKGVLNSQGRLMMLGWGASLHMCHCTPDDVIYCAMPLFHANAQVLAFAPPLLAGGGLALARRFSKSSFLADVRRYRATLFNYVGNPLAYIMDTPAQPDDADNPLRLAYGNEAPRQYIVAFGVRFGCQVIDGYGASEVGVGFQRGADDPARSLGRSPGVKILAEDGRECPPAHFDEAGMLLNADEAVGEIVNTTGRFLFEGYYKDAQSTAERTRDGFFHTADLGYADADGFIYFAGRDAEWLRVGGENFLGRPIEDALAHHPDVMLASVYGVPDPEAGDQVMAAIVLRAGARFDPDAFARFLDAEADLPPRWRPTFLRIGRELAATHTNKILKRTLRREKFLVDRVDDPIYWRPRGADTFRRFAADDLRELRERFQRAGYADRLEQ